MRVKTLFAGEPTHILLALPHADVVDEKLGGPVLAWARMRDEGYGIRVRNERRWQETIGERVLAGRYIPSMAVLPPFHVPIAVFITIDIGSSGIMRGGVREHSLAPPRSWHTAYSPNEAADICQTNWSS